MKITVCVTSNSCGVFVASQAYELQVLVFVLHSLLIFLSPFMLIMCNSA